MDTYFIDAIDCNFPFKNERLSSYLILHACKNLWDVEVLHIIYEILNPWRGDKTSKKLMVNYIDIIDSLWKNNDKNWIIAFSKRKLLKNDFSEGEVLTLLSKAHNYTLIAIIEGLYNDYSEKIDEFADNMRSKAVS